jgi:hypothetical protein
MAKDKPPLTPEEINDPLKMEQVRNEGTIEFWVKDEHKYWATNPDTYVFDPVTRGIITVRCIKRPNRTMDVSIDGPFGKQYKFNAAIPKIETPKGLYVAIVWNRPSIILYLNGKVAQTLET